MKARDTERSRLYKAEAAVFSFKGRTKADVDFPEVHDCEAFVAKVMAGEHWQSCQGYKRIRVHSGAGNRRASWHRRTFTIKLPISARLRWMILHEMAHALRDATGRKNGPAHGPLFRAHYVALVAEFEGTQVSQALEEAFTNAGLLITKRAA